MTKEEKSMLIAGYVSLLRRGLFVLWGGFCVVGRLGRKKKRARGTRWEGGREKRSRFPLPIVPRALSTFSIIDILMGIPSGSLCGGERGYVQCGSSIWFFY